jgi:acetyl esterase/lipase
MHSEHLVDPELKQALDAFPAFELTRDMLPALRAMLQERLAGAATPTDAAVVSDKITIPGPAHAPVIEILHYRAAGPTAPLPALLHIHGGGYILGTAAMMDAENRLLAADLKCAVFSVEYRLAPETPYPGPLEDCYAALKWMYDNASALNIDRTRMGVKGESAGGGLAAALSLLSRDRGEVPLAFQHLIYPMIDDRTGAGSPSDPHRFVGEYVWTRAQNQLGWSALLGKTPGESGVSPYAAAARAEDLTRLPPTFISVGALDLFLEENMDYARRLTRAGVPVEFHLYPGAFHGFDLQPRTARIAQAASRDSREALRRAMYG